MRFMEISFVEKDSSLNETNETIKINEASLSRGSNIHERLAYTVAALCIRRGNPDGWG